MANLLEKASIVLTPTGYSSGFIHKDEEDYIDIISACKFRLSSPVFTG